MRSRVRASSFPPLLKARKSGLFIRRNIIIQKLINKKYFIIILISFLGILLRVFFYSFNRYLWTDEAALALNILNINNYFIPLHWGQAAPTLFMYLSKIMYIIVPQKELALRFFPLLFSICSIFAFNKLISKYCNNLLTKILAITAFSFSYPLVYYAQEFKQYSLDVLIFLLILLSYDYLKILDSCIKKITLSILYSLALYASFPAFFAIFVVFFNLFLFDFDKFKKSYYMIIPIVIMSMLYITTCYSQITDTSLHSYWQNGFLTFDIQHDINLIFSFFEYIFSTKIAVLFPLITILMCIKNKLFNEKYCLLYIPIALAIMLSCMHIYPLQSRVSLYLAPLIIILTTKIIDFISLKNKIIEKIVFAVCCISLLFPLCSYTYNMVIKKNVWLEDFVTPLKLALKEAGKDDIIIIADGGEWLHEYYKNVITINNPVIVEQSFSDENQYIEHLDKYKKGQNYYLIYAHNRNKLKRLNTIYNWARTKDNFNFIYDKSMNAMIHFSL